MSSIKVNFGFNNITRHKRLYSKPVSLTCFTVNTRIRTSSRPRGPVSHLLLLDQTNKKYPLIFRHLFYVIRKNNYEINYRGWKFYPSLRLTNRISTYAQITIHLSLFLFFCRGVGSTRGQRLWGEEYIVYVRLDIVGPSTTCFCGPGTCTWF